MADNALLNNNKLYVDQSFHNVSVAVTHKIPNRSILVPEPVRGAGTMLYNIDNTCTYWSDGVTWRKIFGTGPSGEICLVDADGDTSICVDDEKDNDTIVLTTPAAGGFTATIGTAGMDFDTTGLVEIKSSLAAAAAIHIRATDSVGGVLIESNGGGIALAASSGNLTLGAGVDAVQAIYVHADGGTTETIRIHSDQGTSVGSVTIESDVGGLTFSSGLSSADAINLTASTGAGGVDINTGSSGVAVDMALGTMVVTTTHPDTSAGFQLSQSGTNGDNAEIFVGDRDPSATITGVDGSLYIRANGASSQLWQNTSTAPSGTTWTQFAAGGGDVSAASNITDHAVVRGDGGVKGVQSSGVILDDADSLTGITSATIGTLITTAGRIKSMAQFSTSTTTGSLGLRSVYNLTSHSGDTTLTVSSADIALGSATEAVEFIVKDTSGNLVSNGRKLTIATQGAETIDGATSIDITADYGVLRLFSDGSNLFSW